MSLFSRIAGIVGSFFQVGGPNGPALKNNTGNLDARDPTDTTFVNVRVADPVAATDAITLQFFRAQPAAGAIAWPNIQGHHLLWYSGFDLISSVQVASGWKLISNAGTAAVVAPSAGSKLNGTRRTKYTSTAASQLGVFEGFNGVGGFYIWIGDAPGRGGFKSVSRFAVVSSGATCQWFHHHGVGNFAGSPGFVDYTTNTTVSRVMLVQSYTTSAGGAIPGGTNWKVSECSGAANTLTDTGIPVVHNNLVEFILYCTPNGIVNWTVNDLTANTTSSGTCTTTPPANTVFMCPAVHAAVNVAGAGTNEVDVAIIFAEMFD